MGKIKHQPVRILFVVLLAVLACLSSGLPDYISLAEAARLSQEEHNQVGAQAAILPVVSLQVVAPGFVSPVQITNAGDGSGRLFVVQQAGQVFIVQNGVKLAQPFLDIQPKVSCCGERGLLSIAFSPDYPVRPFVYVNYTDLFGNTVVSRFTSAAGSITADSNSEVVILYIAQPYANHNGGQLAFGPDGYLYIGMGDGGSGGDPENRAQNPAELLGKILRIDVESPGCTNSPPPMGRNYCIPPDNPYIQMPGYQPEIWALGLRNPWRFTFDRQTGDLWISDVGQGSREEVDFQPAASTGGENYGWNILEGTMCYPLGGACAPPPGYSPPVFEYDHASGRCSITGGFVYRGPVYPHLMGAYIFADFCTGEIWGLANGSPGQAQLLLDVPFFISSFGEDESGMLYTADYTNGVLYRIAAADPGPNTLYFPVIFG